ncbi:MULTISPECIES: phosphonate ABC transporter, permease protein PhnE [unclassified Bradyrhizobium]|uniref:phosphonate ABC transporter, permease protein PhnE n=1 Tax=unclassified Bradyrhizobium TaxID=2631580 RepID=UPI000678EE2E|nr:MULTISPECIES: phosphonate ABC transporter, permease protein PhnE [unclassified Bradyrhizobium]
MNAESKRDDRMPNSAVAIIAVEPGDNASAGQTQPSNLALSEILIAHRRTRQRRVALLLLGLAVFIGAAYKVGLNPLSMARGLEKLGGFLRSMVPPTAGGHFSELLYALGQTVAMAFVGTVLAAVIAIPLSFLGASNVVGVWPLRFVVRRLFDFVRGVDVLIWALIFVSAVGLTPFAGIMAIAIADGAVLAKVFSEIIEQIDNKQIEGVQSCGADRLTLLRWAYVPQILPLFLSNILYYFESNARSATILGVVGAGGLGYELSERMQLLLWDQVFMVVLMILAVVTLIDFASRVVRRQIA